MKLREGTAGRVQSVNGQYLAHPSACCMCGRAPKHIEEPFLNLLVELDYFGALYMCTDCGSEIAEAMGYIPHDRHETLRNEYNILTAQVLDQFQKINYLKGLLNARIDLARYGQPDSDGTISVPVLEDESGQDSVDEIINGLQPVPAESGKGD
jgi:hypothetical protein